MLVIDISDFSQNMDKVFESALTNEVIINKNGMNYKILPVKNIEKTEKSPFEDIPYITANITTQEIVEIIRENRAGI